METEDSLAPLKRKSHHIDDLEKTSKKQKTSNSNSGALSTITPPSSSNSSNATTSYDQSSNQYDANYNHHRKRSNFSCTKSYY